MYATSISVQSSGSVIIFTLYIISTQNLFGSMPNLCMTNFFKFDILNIAGHCKYLGTLNWLSISSSLLWWFDFSSLLPESLFSSSLDRYKLLLQIRGKRPFVIGAIAWTKGSSNSLVVGVFQHQRYILIWREYQMLGVVATLLRRRLLCFLLSESVEGATA